MNIESANLSFLPPSSVTVANMSQLLAEGSVSLESFSGALIAQVELSSSIEALGVLPTPDLSGLQDARVLPVVAVATADTQDFAALLGNTLPVSYKIKDETDHEAALAAVTDTLKYIATGTTAGEKSAEAAKNLKEVIAMTVPVEQNTADVAAAAEQGISDVITAAVPVQQGLRQPEKKQVEGGNQIVGAADDHTADVATAAEQGISDVITAAVPVQQGLRQPEKKQVEGENQIVGAADDHGADGFLAAIIFPAVMPIEQGAAVNNLASSDTIKQDMIKQEAPLPFIKFTVGGAKPYQSANAPDNVLQNAAGFDRPVQDKQGFNLKYFENGEQSEKTGPIERKIFSAEGEKDYAGVGVDLTQLNKPVADNKTDIPAMTKPLAHPEWNKDLGERIVWMSSKAIPTAEIRLNPEHLGPVSVRVNVADDQATVVFTAQHAVTREALEASIPKLREMMSAQQIYLAEVNISQGSASDQGRSQTQNFAQTAEGRGQGVAVDGVDDVEQEIESGRAVVGKGLLSIYA